jgi:hypothetical protein
MLKFIKVAVTLVILVIAGAFIYEKFYKSCDCDEGKCR